MFGEQLKTLILAARRALANDARVDDVASGSVHTPNFVTWMVAESA